MKKFLKKVCILLCLIIIVSAGILILNGYNLYKTAIAEMSIKDKCEEIKAQTENYTNFSELPENYINAVVAVEDRRFFEHNGIDFVSIGRAVIADIKTLSFAEGGSTITQQLAKNTYFTQKKQITRKIAEVFMAFQYEKECSKEEIFELYINTMYFGDGYYNVYDACEGYFDKKVEDMNLYECTLLAGIPNAPSVYSPTKNPELAKQRQAQVLYKMVRYDFLTQEEADKIHDQ